MRNKRKIPRRGKSKIAVVVDGKTEAWYFNMLNRNETEAKFQIKPEIPQRKSLEEQFEKVLDLSDNYDQVIWVVDLDVILKEKREVKKGDKSSFDKFLEYSRKLTDLPNVKIIINQPCLEYWFLLHFEFTQAPFNDCLDAEQKLKKYLKDYSKSQEYFTKEGKDIYLRLREFLPKALENSNRLRGFDQENPNLGFTGMHQLFKLLGLV